MTSKIWLNIVLFIVGFFIYNIKYILSFFKKSKNINEIKFHEIDFNKIENLKNILWGLNCMQTPLDKRLDDPIIISQIKYINKICLSEISTELQKNYITKH